MASLPNLLAKQMLKLFGFPYLTAPGEAEAECALFQREGIVDAVLSEDVDTLMFGCTLSIRNWSSEGTRGNKSPTHVSTYHAKGIKEGKAGLDREGMVLIALMSGGDYIPAGVPGCGIKIACEAARAGFGKDLCSLSRKDTVGIRQWRERLEHELRNNESGFFRVKHKALRIPETFPDKSVLGYYTHPIVSSSEKISNLKESIKWSGVVDIQGLRAFVADAFEWQHLAGARKFIRGFAPALLVHRLRKRGEECTTNSFGLEFQAEEEAGYIKTICGQRTHFATDGVPELRVAYVPAEIVDIDLDQEETDDYAGITGKDNDSELEEPGSDEEDRSRSRSPTKIDAPSTYDPSQPEKIWILETFAKLGVPLLVETYEENMRNPKKFASRKARQRTAITKSGMTKGALDAFVKVSKPNLGYNKIESPKQKPRSKPKSTLQEILPVCQEVLPVFQEVLPIFLAPEMYPKPKRSRQQNKVQNPIILSSTPGTPNPKLTPKEKISRTTISISLDNSPKNININPWTLSRRPSYTLNIKLDRNKRYSALGIYGSPQCAESAASSLDSSPRPVRRSIPSPPPAVLCKHARSPSFSPDDSDEGSGVNALDVHDGKSDKALTEGPRYNIYHSSPRKMQTPVKEANEIRQLRTLTSTGSLRSAYGENAEAVYTLQPSNSLKVNGRLDLGTPSPMLKAVSASMEASLGTPSPELPPVCYEEDCYDTVNLPLSHLPHKTSETKRSRRFVAVRESLEGAWKEMDQWEARVMDPKYAYEGVEVLDLTRS
ncbi:MAG: hypothetical protein Q9187_005870 [Circinaria calcarea]